MRSVTDEENRRRAQPPIDTRVELETPSSAAGGLGAIAATTSHVVRHLGPIRGALTVLRTNQRTGFDCPGCAWPEPERDRSFAEFCENGAKAVASEATRARADEAFFAARSIEDLAARADVWLNDAGRLTCPLVRRAGDAHFAPIGWDEAFALLARELRALGSPNEAAFYTSGRTSNEAAFLYQLFVRRFGTNNLPDCSNMCHESSGVGLGETLGVGKGTVSLDDFALADAIFVVGQNPGTNHPRMLSALEEAARGGATIVSINPLREVGTMRFRHPQDPAAMVSAGTELARLHLPVRINGDVAALKGIMKAMLAAEAAAPGSVLDHAFLTEHTDGFDALAEDLATTSWDEIERGSGLSRASIEAAARVAIASERTIVCWAMGLTQHVNAVANVQSIVNLLLLRGNVGRPGAGPCPVRGHSNVQGDRTMGIWEKMPDAFLDRLGEEFAFAPPRAHGLDVVDTIRAMGDGRVKVFFALGGNFLSASPDTARTADALARCRLVCHVSTKLHRGHFVEAGTTLVLPCLGRTERDEQASGPQRVTVENSMSVVSASEGTLAPASPHLLSEVAIVSRLARATLGAADPTPWEAFTADYGLIRARIARVVPGFERFDERLAEHGTFVLPNGARERTFRTATARARFTVHPIPSHDLRDGELLMMTIRSHDQYNTTVYGERDRYRGIKRGRRIVMMNAEDIAARGLVPGEEVDLVSRFRDDERRAERFVTVAYEIPRGCVATYFPEANVLVPLEHVAEKSNTPASKSVVVRVEARTARP